MGLNASHFQIKMIFNDRSFKIFLIPHKKKKHKQTELAMAWFEKKKLTLIYES